MDDLDIRICDIILCYQASGFGENVSDLRRTLSGNMQPCDTKVVHALMNACKAGMESNSCFLSRNIPPYDAKVVHALMNECKAGIDSFILKKLGLCDKELVHALVNACKAVLESDSVTDEHLQKVVSLFLLISKLATVFGAKPGQILDLSKAEIQNLGNSESATKGLHGVNESDEVVVEGQHGVKEPDEVVVDLRRNIQEIMSNCRVEGFDEVVVLLTSSMREISQTYLVHGFKESISDLRKKLAANMQDKESLVHTLVEASKACIGNTSYTDEVKMETVVLLVQYIAKLASLLGADVDQLLNLSKAHVRHLGNRFSARSRLRSGSI